jgi:hypothetical protein
MGGGLMGGGEMGGGLMGGGEMGGGLMGGGEMGGGLMGGGEMGGGLMGGGEMGGGRAGMAQSKPTGGSVSTRPLKPAAPGDPGAGIHDRPLSSGELPSPVRWMDSSKGLVPFWDRPVYTPVKPVGWRARGHTVLTVSRAYSCANTVHPTHDVTSMLPTQQCIWAIHTRT